MIKREYKYEWDILLVKCTKCGGWNTIDFYPKHPWCMFWVRPQCKICYNQQKKKYDNSEYKKAYREKNKEKIAEYHRNYREKNKDLLRKKRKIYVENNKEKIAESKRRYVELNKEKIANHNKEYCLLNKEKISDYKKNYYSKNKQKVLSHNREYVKNNKSKVDSYKENYYKINKPIILEKEREYARSRTEYLWFNWTTFHTKTRRFIKKYNLLPSKCPICWSDKNIQAHHPYYRTFDDRCMVVFCCQSCHHRIHAWWFQCPQPINLLTLNQK